MQFQATALRFDECMRISSPAYSHSLRKKEGEKEKREKVSYDYGERGTERNGDRILMKKSA